MSTETVFCIQRNKTKGKSKMAVENSREIKNFSDAVNEARRCLQCAKPMCRTGCPIENDIPAFIKALAQGNVGEASRIISDRSNLPAICGRVCPHEQQCEASCILSKTGKGIRIGELERFIADLSNELVLDSMKIEKRSGKIAIIGSGPAGITVAGDLAKLGFSVTIFESQMEPGGVLMYGIPDFRLPKDIVRRETAKLGRLGVEIRTQTMVGKDITVDGMFEEGYDAVFMGTGTALPSTLDLEGKDLPGIITATYFLSSVALAADGHLPEEEIPVRAGERVIVIGAGNVAMDAARTALRQGAERVVVVYRRTVDEMTALRSEYDHAFAEGVQFSWLTAPVSYLGNGRVQALKIQKMKMVEGKLVVTNEMDEIVADKIILAVGQRPASRIVTSTQGIEVDEMGYVITRERPFGMTTRAGVFACGDVVHGPATVVLAMKEAKKVASGIASYVEAIKFVSEF